MSFYKPGMMGPGPAPLHHNSNAHIVTCFSAEPHHIYVINQPPRRNHVPDLPRKSMPDLSQLYRSQSPTDPEPRFMVRRERLNSLAGTRITGEARVLSPSPSFEGSNNSSGHNSNNNRPHKIESIINSSSNSSQDTQTAIRSRDLLLPGPTESVNMTPSRVVLLCCGSFNPITNMHLRMFEIARDSLHKTGRYKVIGGIISPVSDGYGKKDLLPSKHRCAMVERALQSNDWIRLDTWESEQPAWSETEKILSHHRSMLDDRYNMANDTPSKKRKMGHDSSPDDLDYNAQNVVGNLNEKTPVHLKLLCGGDLLESFATPGLWKPQDMEEIVSTYGLVVISRNGSDPGKFVYETDTLYKHQKNIHIVTEWITNEISSTKIRRALHRGDSVKYLVQDSVIRYIEDHQLFGAGDNKLMNYKVMTPSPEGDDVDEPATPSPPPSIEGHDLRYITPQHYHSDDAMLQPDFSNTHAGLRRFRRINNNRNLHSDDSDDSMERSPPLPRRPISCIGADISGLVRRVKNMRVGVTPETCV